MKIAAKLGVIASSVALLYAAAQLNLDRRDPRWSAAGVQHVSALAGRAAPSPARRHTGPDGARTAESTGHQPALGASRGLCIDRASPGGAACIAGGSAGTGREARANASADGAVSPPAADRRAHANAEPATTGALPETPAAAETPPAAHKKAVARAPRLRKTRSASRRPASQWVVCGPYGCYLRGRMRSPAEPIYFRIADHSP